MSCSVDDYLVHLIYAHLCCVLVLRYATKVAVVFALLISLTTTKAVTSSRPQFVRESGSGYNFNAYFCAMNLVVTVEHTFRAIVASLIALCIRNSLALWYTFIVNFLMISWISASWGLLFALCIQEKYLIMAIGVHVVFFGLLFCGVIPPISFEGSFFGLCSC